MSASLRIRYSRLLRWYPKAWRQEHGRFMLDTLLEQAGDRGIKRPGIAEAWSIRSHGLGERATNRWAVAASAVSLAAFAVATGILLSDALQLPGAGIVRTLLAVFVGPLALSLAAVIMLHWRGVVAAEPSLWMAAFAAPAWALAAVAAASWSMAFGEADAGTGRTWFGTNTALFILLAWLLGAVGLVVPLLLLPRKGLPAPVRWLLACVIALVFTMLLGMLAVAGQMLGAVAAAVVLVLALLAGKAAGMKPRPADAPVLATSQPLPVSPSKAAFRAPIPPVRPTTGRVAACAAAALFSLVAGLGCAAFSLTGSIWAPGVEDSTHAMNLGLAAGAVAGIPAAAAAGAVLVPRFGAVMRISALLLCLGLAVVAAAQFAGAGHELQWPLMLLAALMAGFAFALPISRIVTDKLPACMSLSAALGLAAAVPALMAAAAAAFIMPVVATVLAVLLLPRLTGRGPQPSIGTVDPG